MPIKVLGDNGTGTLGDVLFGMEWAVTNAVKENIAVMSMSLARCRALPEPSATLMPRSRGGRQTRAHRRGSFGCVGGACRLAYQHAADPSCSMLTCW